MKALPVLLAASALLFGTFASAQSADENPREAADGNVSIDELRERIAESLPGLVPTSVAETPIAGLFELVVDGQIYYVNESADYLLDGSLIELQTRTNVTEGRLGGIQSSLIEEMGEENMLIYEPEEASDRSITVFTDISCGYCRRLHEDIDALLELGLAEGAFTDLTDGGVASLERRWHTLARLPLPALAEHPWSEPARVPLELRPATSSRGPPPL